MTEPLMTLKDVAALMSVPVGTLYQWRKPMPPAVKMGRGLRFRRADVDASIDAQFAGDVAA